MTSDFFAIFALMLITGSWVAVYFVLKHSFESMAKLRAEAEGMVSECQKTVSKMHEINLNMVGKIEAMEKKASEMNVTLQNLRAAPSRAAFK